MLKKAHVQARLKFANEHPDDTENAWLNVIASDETKIELHELCFKKRITMSYSDIYLLHASSTALDSDGV